jgi:glutathione S-transferase
MSIRGRLNVFDRIIADPDFTTHTKENMMAIELYWGSGSPFAWRVMLALEWKKIPYTSKMINFSNSEHKAPTFLALNPRGKVPVLKDGDVVLYETLAIMNYLERKQPEPALFGRTPTEAATVYREVSECIYYFELPAFEVIAPVFFGGVDEKGAAMKVAAESLHKELGRIEKILTTANWLVGDKPSAADIWWYPETMLLERAGAKDVAKPLNLDLGSIAKRYPAIGRWRKRVEAQPGYERTYPPHWKQAA